MTVVAVFGSAAILITAVKDSGQYFKALGSVQFLQAKFFTQWLTFDYPEFPANNCLTTGDALCCKALRRKLWSFFSAVLVW